MKTYNISYLGIDEYVWDVLMSIAKKVGMDQANIYVDPLRWYISTGRASASFLKKLIAYKPFVIGRVLMRGGSVDEAIDAVMAKIEFTK